MVIYLAAFLQQRKSMLLPLNFCCLGLVSYWEKRYRCINRIRWTQSMPIESRTSNGWEGIWRYEGKKEEEWEGEVERASEKEGVRHCRGRRMAWAEGKMNGVWGKEKYRNITRKELGSGVNYESKTQQCHVREGGWRRTESLDCQDEQFAFWTQQWWRVEEKTERHGSLWSALGFGRPMKKLWRLGLQCCRTKNSKHALQESNLSANFSETQSIPDAPAGRTTCRRSALAFSCLQILKHGRHLLNPLPDTHLTLGILMVFPSIIKVSAQISSLQRDLSCHMKTAPHPSALLSHFIFPQSITDYLTSYYMSICLCPYYLISNIETVKVSIKS